MIELEQYAANTDAVPPRIVLRTGLEWAATAESALNDAARSGFLLGGIAASISTTPRRRDEGWAKGRVATFD